MDRPVAHVEHVEDLDDPRLADYRHLIDAAARSAARHDDEGGCTVVEGTVALATVVAHGPPLRSVLLTPSKVDALRGVLADVPPDVPILVAERPVLRQVVGFDLHRGVLASAVRPPPRAVADVLADVRRVVVAEGLNDHENLGALFRNAAALGMGAVLLDDRTADPLYRRSVRVSSGWSAALPHARTGALPAGFAPIRERGMRIVALSPAPGSIDVDRAAADGHLDDPLALVVGAEGPGLRAETIAAADVVVRVPMADAVDSLNVATALAVVASFAAAARGWH